MNAHQKRLLYIEKQRYADQLKQEIEKSISTRKHNIWVRHIKDTYKECDKNVDFNQKNGFIEERIELTHKYFTHLNDFNNKDKELNKIKKDLFRFQRELKKKQQRKTQTDPYEVIKNLSDKQMLSTALPTQSLLEGAA